MNKGINKYQLDMMVENMCENREIAQGFVKEKKEDVTAFWEKLVEELNSIGPPVRSVAEWKKCWNDQKRNVRKKACQNRQEQVATGGGPNKQVKLSPTEDQIFHPIGVKEAVEGLSAVKRFVNPNFISNEVCDTEDIRSPSVNATNVTQAQSNPINTPKRPKSQIALDVTIESVKVQKEFCDDIRNVGSCLKTFQEDMERNMKRTYRALDKMTDEMKRHNKELEKIKKKIRSGNRKKPFRN